MNNKQDIGKYGENVASTYLKSNGYVILERNWRWRKSEIDIIAMNSNNVVFVEVKTRSSGEFGSPENFVSNRQQKMIIDAAHEYIVSKDIDLEARFDIIAIIIGAPANVNHIEGAFYPF